MTHHHGIIATMVYTCKLSELSVLDHEYSKVMITYQGLSLCELYFVKDDILKMLFEALFHEKCLCYEVEL